MEHLNLTGHWAATGALLCFVLAYGIAVAEERLQVRKSVPVMVAALLIWILVALAYASVGQVAAAGEAARHTMLEFAALLLFLVPAMTFVNTLEDRGLFDALRVWLIERGLSLRALFWVTGMLAFVVSPIADNLTTALLLGAVAMSVGRGHPAFIAASCVNVVVAANAGGAFSPFGDITTLMVWQAGKAGFTEFFALVVPSLVNWLVPAVALSLAIERGQPSAVVERAILRPGAFQVLVLFLATIALTVTVHSTLGLPPAVGMMGGLALLKTYAYLFRAGLSGGATLVDELDDVFAESALQVDEDEMRTSPDALGQAAAPVDGAPATGVAVVVPP
ncbi:MAG: sodium:proton antiporter NhaD, partial [Chloroflexota bacterium]|nr:sodium:proton antiporter NhaD [Chloroflexota bacterium]